MNLFLNKNLIFIKETCQMFNAILIIIHKLIIIIFYKIIIFK